jgi:serine/threonine protein kinase
LQFFGIEHMLAQFQERGLHDDEVRKVIALKNSSIVSEKFPDLCEISHDAFIAKFNTQDPLIREIAFADLVEEENGLIGQGSFGEVRKMQLKFNGLSIGPVAVKLSIAAVVSYRRDTWLSELQRMHPLRGSSHVVKCLGQVTGLPGDKMGIVLELLQCKIGDKRVENVLQLLHITGKCDAEGFDAGLLGWGDKFRICLGVAKGLRDIHASNLLHRDLKVENVLVGGTLGPHLVVKIADFGQSKYVDDLTVYDDASTPKASLADSTISNVAAKSTIRISAPELLGDAAPQYSVKSDIFALGILMWEVSKGGRAYGIDQIKVKSDLQVCLEDVKQTVLRGDYDPCFDDFFEQQRMPDGCKNPWTALIKSCWKICEERPDVDAVVSDIEKLLDRASAP